MNAKSNAVRAGFSRGWIEFKQTLTNGQDIANYVIFPVMSIAAMFLMRNATVPGSSFSLGSLALPGVIGMTVVFSGMMGTAASLTVDREDGTLLRAKATPDGLIGYLVGRTAYLSGAAIVSAVVVLVPGLILFKGFDVGTVGAWVGLAAVLVLGLLATLPIGAIIGSLGNNPGNLGLVFLPILAMVAVSGIFYPITSLPGWLQVIGQLLPMYWVGLGMRWALLPDSLSSVEIGESWRLLEMAGVLGVWTVIGFLVAPIVLRRMARREAGSDLDERRQRAMQRIQ